MFEEKLIKRYCLTTLLVNETLLLLRYRTKIKIKIYNNQSELLLGFAEMISLYQLDVEIEYNTGDYNQLFVLKKIKLLGLLQQEREGISLNSSDNIVKKFATLILSRYNLKFKNIGYNFRESDIRVVVRDIEEKMKKYEFTRMNVVSHDIKANPIENIKCEYFNIPGTIFLDLFVWARKTFPTEIKNILDEVLKRCRLEGKVDLPYILTDDNLRSMYIYVNALIYKDNIEKLENLSLQISKLCNIDYKRCLRVFHVFEETLQNYALEITYYCSVDSLRCQELMKKRNIIGDYIQSAKSSCVTISNVFTNGVGYLVCNFYGRKAAERNMLISMKRKGMIEITKYKGAIVLNPKKNNKK